MTLREARRSRGWTQEQLAAESGVDQTTISRLETTSNPNPTLETAERLATALGIAPSRLRFAKPSTASSVGVPSDRSGQAVSPTEAQPDDRRADDRRDGERRDGDRRRSFERRVEAR